MPLNTKKRYSRKKKVRNIKKSNTKKKIFRRKKTKRKNSKKRKSRRMRGGATIWTLKDFKFKHDYGKLLSTQDAIKHRTEAVGKMLKKLNAMELEKTRQEDTNSRQNLSDDETREKMYKNLQQLESAMDVHAGIFNDLQSLSKILNDKDYIKDNIAKLTWVKAHPDIPPEKKKELGPGQINFYEFYFKDLAERIKALLVEKDTEIKGIKALLVEKNAEIYKLTQLQSRGNTPEGLRNWALEKSNKAS
jgi:hypothetical protein